MFWIYSVATLLQSAGYGIPQTYLSEYARNVSALSPTFSTLLLTLINIPGICSSTFFGFLSDNKHFHLSAPTVTAISAISSALAALLFWGLAARGGIALLILFALTFGFFASAYSATWGGIMNEMEKDAADNNEAIDSGVLYGLLNGARGIGYVSGGLLSVPLLKAGSSSHVGNFRIWYYLWTSDHLHGTIFGFRRLGHCIHPAVEKVVASTLRVGFAPDLFPWTTAGHATSAKAQHEFRAGVCSYSSRHLRHSTGLFLC
jgi:MFS family permease